MGRGSGKGLLAAHPARFVVLAFAAAIAAGTALLSLPIATADDRPTDLIASFFTATSAVCVTGLAVYDVGTHLTGFGQAVVLVLAQLGGLGFMTLASLIFILVSQRLGLRFALAASTERSTLSLGDVRRVLTGVAVVTLATEAVIALVLTVRLLVTYDYALDDAIWHGVFHSVMAFNNAGFSLYPDSLERFAFDRIFTGAIMVGVVIGGLGFPVLVDLYQRRRSHRRWRSLSLHSRITMAATTGLFAAGFVVLSLFEWGNPRTMGRHSIGDKLWLGLFGSVTPRTAGFHTMNPSAMTDEGLLATMALMFVGAGSAGTSGGIKVGTFALLGLVILAELRGSPEVVAFGRRIPDRVQRQALTVALLAVGVIAGATTLLLWSSDWTLRDAAFEAVSAFGTVGLTTRGTAELPSFGQLSLTVVMFIGRLGPVTLGTALVLRMRTTRIRHPEEAPLIG
jgi:potassium uptake TrkH family protein